MATIYFYNRIANSTFTTSKSGTTYTVTVKPDTGYQIKTSVVPKYSEGISGTKYNFSTWTKERAVAYVQNPSTNVYLWGETEATATKANITTALTNCTLVTDISNLNVGDSVTLVLNANSGYQFTEIPTFAGDESFTISDDKLSATLSTVAKDGVIIGSATLIPVLVNITTDITDCTLETDLSNVYVGDSVTLTLTTDSEHKFIESDKPYFTDKATSTRNYFTLTTDKLSTLSITAEDGSIKGTGFKLVKVSTDTRNCTLESSVALDNIAVGEVVTFTITPITDFEFTSINTPYILTSSGNKVLFTKSDGKYVLSYGGAGDYSIIAIATAIKYKVVIDFTVANATLATDVSDLYLGDLVDLEIVANTGYEFRDSPPLFNSTPFTITDNGAKAVLEIEITSRSNLITGQAYKYDSDISTANAFFTTYLPTEDNITELSNTYFNQLLQSVDVGKYILKMYQTNIPISPDDDSREIYLGTYPTGITSAYTSEQIVSQAVDFTLDEINGNIFDYEPYNSVEIYIPFVGVKTIEPSKVVGRKLTLKAFFNLYTLQASFYLYADNVLVLTDNGVFGFEFPYYLNGYYNFKNGNDYFDNGGDLQACIIQRVKTPNDNGYSLYGTNANTLKALQDLKGFNRVELEEISSSKATNDEIENIKTILSKGVFF